MGNIDFKMDVCVLQIVGYQPTDLTSREKRENGSVPFPAGGGTAPCSLIEGTPSREANLNLRWWEPVKIGEPSSVESIR